MHLMVRGRSVWCVGVVLACAPLSSAQILSEWTGAGGTGLWSTGANWNPGGVPCNDDATDFDVVIPGDEGVITADTACTVSAVTLGVNTELVIPASTDLLALVQASIGGTINSTGGDFAALTDAAFVDDSAKVFASAGGNVTIWADDYDSSGLWQDDGAPGLNTVFNHYLFAAGDSGTVIDLSALTSIYAGFWSTGNDDDVQHIGVWPGARIDLSNLESVIGPRDNFQTPNFGGDRIQLYVVGAGATLDLSSLRMTDTVGPAGEVRLGAYEGGTLELPALEDVRNTLLEVSGGSSMLANASTATFTVTNMWADGNDSISREFSRGLMSSRDAGSVLDVRCFTAIDASYDSPGNDREVLWIAAWDQGMIDASSVATMTAPHDAADRLDVSSTGSGSLVDLSGLSVIDSVDEGWARLAAYAGGELVLGGLDVRTYVDLWSESGGSSVRVLGDLAASAGPGLRITMGDGSGLSVEGSLALRLQDVLSGSTGSLLTIGGDLWFSAEHTTNFQLGDTTLVMDGATESGGPQHLEVGGVNVGSAPRSAFPSNNFGVGRLVVGSPGQPTTVRLVDFEGNLGCGEDFEALYVFGLGDGNSGLRIHSGSTLNIGSINVYVSDDPLLAGEHLNSLFPPGVDVIAYDEGFLRRASCNADWNHDLVFNTADFVAFLNDYTSAAAGEPVVYGNPDIAQPCGVLNTSDFIAYLNLFAAGCEF